MQVNSPVGTVASPWHSVWNHSVHLQHSIHFLPLRLRQSSLYFSPHTPHGVLSVESNFLFSTFCFLFSTPQFCFFFYALFDCSFFALSVKVFLYEELVSTPALSALLFLSSTWSLVGYGKMSTALTRAPCGECRGTDADAGSGLSAGSSNPSDAADVYCYLIETLSNFCPSPF